MPYIQKKLFKVPTQKKKGGLFNGLLSPLDDYFDQGFKAFIKGSQKDIRRKNNRSFNLISKIKGPEFVSQLKWYLKENKANGNLIRFVRSPVGHPFNYHHPNAPLITGLWFTCESTADGSAMKNTLCVLIKENRWLQIQFTLPFIKVM